MEETRIGKYIWTTKNLDVSTYQRGPKAGQPIRKATDWSIDKYTWGYYSGNNASWCWYMNDSLKYSKYGKIYNAKYELADIIPKGYHIPTINEWTDLFQTLGNYVNDYEKPPFKLLYGGYREEVNITNSSGWYQGFSPILSQQANFWTSKIAPMTYSLTRNNDFISIRMEKNYRGNYLPCELTDWQSWPIKPGGGIGRRAGRDAGMYIRLVKDY